MKGLVRLLVVSVFVVVGLSVVGASAASAADCYKVDSATEPSMWLFWGDVPNCLHLEEGKGDYVLVKGTGVEITPTLWCYEAGAEEPSSWSDNKCSVEKANGGFVAVELHLWTVDGVAVAGSLAVKTEGELELTDLKIPLFGETTLKCSGQFIGTVKEHGEDEITEVLNLAGTSTTIVCSGVKGACGTSAEAATVEAENLPWKTLLVLDLDASGNSTVLLDVLYTENSAAEPGYKSVCKSSLLSDLCEGYVGAVLTQSGANVLGTFNLVEQEEQEETGACTQGGTGSAHIQGSGPTSLTGAEAGLTLSTE